jgi:hypothetical protein
MNMRTSGYTCALAVLLLASSAARAEQADDEGWRFLVAPYVWTAGIDGEAGAKGTTADIDWSFSDILENLDMAFMGQFEAHKGRFGFVVSPVLMSLSDDADGPIGFLEADAGLDATIVDAFATWEVMPDLELLAGARYTQIDVDFRLHNNISGATVSVDGSDNWTDPIVGARFSHAFDDHWSMNLRGDVGGGAGESDLVWNASAIVAYKLGESGQAFLGYRILDYDYENGDAADRTTFNIRIDGPAIGYGWTF